MSKENALKSYSVLLQKALKVAKEWVIASFCDKIVNFKTFLDLLKKVSEKVGKKARIKWTTFQSPDHIFPPFHMLYLKAFWCEVL